MSDSAVAPAVPADLLPAVLAVSLTALNLLRPCYAPDTGELVDFSLAYLNPAAQRMTGLTEQPGGTMRTHFPDAFRNGVFPFYRRVFETQEAGTYAVNYQADGLDNYFRVAAQRAGEYLVVSFTDTADQPRSTVELALRASQAAERAARADAEAQRQRLNDFMSAAPGVVLSLVGPQHVIEFANEGFRQQVGVPDPIGKSFLEAIAGTADQYAPDYQATDLYDHIYRTGEPYYAAEAPYYIDPTHSGQRELRYFTFAVQAARDGSGRITGVQAFATDVTDHVRARQQVQTLNEELAARNEELRASNEEYLAANRALHAAQQQSRQFNAELESRVQTRTQEAQLAQRRAEMERQRLEQLFLQAPAAICILDGPALVYELVNPAYQQLFPGRALRGKPLLEALPELTDQPVWHTLQQVYQTGQTHLELGICIPVARTEGGPLEAFYFNYIQQARFDAQGRIDGVVVFAFDVSEQVRARQQVQALNEELRASNAHLTRTNADLDTFVYAASHDLKSPIANIEGLLNALRDYLPSAAQEPMVPRLLGMMDGAISRFQQTVGHLTNISRLQAAEPTTETADLAAVLEDVRLDVLPLLESTHAELRVAVAECPAVRFSVKNLRSVLFNLLSNAVKYRAAGRPPLVQVRTHHTPAHVVLAVQDNGLGLSAEQQAQLFTMFRRLHTHVEGSGVGLYLLKRLVENAGGTVAVQSELGVGSTFTITLLRA